MGPGHFASTDLIYNGNGYVAGLRKSGQPLACARDRAAKGDCGTFGDWGQPPASCAATTHGERLVVVVGRRAWLVAGRLAGRRDDGFKTSD